MEVTKPAQGSQNDTSQVYFELSPDYMDQINKQNCEALKKIAHFMTDEQSQHENL